MRRALVFLIGIMGLPLAASAAAADVVRVVVERRSVAWDGHAFGAAGSYELIQARVHFVFNPADPADAAVVDLALAPRNAEGLVEAAITVYVLQPVDVQRRRGVAWVDLDGWGVGPAAHLLAAARTATPLPEAGLGDGLLLEEGLTLIQLDMGRDGLPRPQGPDGGPVTARDTAGGEVIGWVRRQWEPTEPTDRLDLDALDGWHHPVALPEAPVHLLFTGPAGAPATDTVPSAAWRLLPLPGGGDAHVVVSDEGFEAGRRYELLYRARTPRLQGLSLAVVRDIMAYARYDVRSVFPADRGVAFGSGIGGRLLRQFLHDGFNDAGGRPAFDLVWAHGAGAGRGDLNRRFAQPGEESDFVALFPFTLDAQLDPVSGREGGLLRVGGGAVPRTLFTHPGSDYPERAASLTHTALDGLADRIPSGRHRSYHLAGTVAGPHEAGSDRPDPRPLLRALAVAALGWVEAGIAPPDSRLPTVGAGTLVRPTAVAHPPLPPGGTLRPVYRPVYRVDPGPRFDSLGIADRATPIRGPAFAVLLPQVDGFGNELGGVRPLELRVPLATYPTAGGAPPLPLRLTPAAEGSGDPRPALSSLYGSEGGFLARVRAALDALVDERFLLERDRQAVLERARQRWVRLAAVPDPPP